MLKNVIKVAVVVLVVLAVVKDPSGSAVTTRQFGAWLADAAWDLSDVLIGLVDARK